MKNMATLNSELIKAKKQRFRDWIHGAGIIAVFLLIAVSETLVSVLLGTS